MLFRSPLDEWGSDEDNNNNHQARDEEDHVGDVPELPEADYDETNDDDGDYSSSSSEDEEEEPEEMNNEREEEKKVEIPSSLFEEMHESYLFKSYQKWLQEYEDEEPNHGSGGLSASVYGRSTSSSSLSSSKVAKKKAVSEEDLQKSC